MAEDERQIRSVAETLLSGSMNYQRSSFAQHSITRTPDIGMGESLIAGAMQNGRMSNVRRFFCLFVTFDLLLTFLMWLICTMIAGESLNTAFLEQVVHYRIKSSLFDIVMAALCRFTVLLLFYALLYLNHWIVVATTTTMTCAFMITKVFLFDWSTYSQPVFQVLLILTSFVLAWVEAWFFDIRVLPQEMQARDWFGQYNEAERAPLLRSVVADTRNSASVEPHGTYFTPIDSPDHSDSEEETTRKQGGTRRLSGTSEMFVSKSLQKLSPDAIDDYKRKATILTRQCYDLLTSENWRIESVLSNDDVIYFMDLPKPAGRILKIVGIINVRARTLIDRLFDGIESSPTWNKLVSESIRLQQIDDDTDIVYQTTTPQIGGMVRARDFIILRHRKQCGEHYISSGISVPLASLPKRNSLIRAENGVGCWAAEDLANEDNKCLFTWILNTNLKGWLPQKIVDKSLSTALTDFMSYVRDHVEDTRASTA